MGQYADQQKRSSSAGSFLLAVIKARFFDLAALADNSRRFGH
jgi:hypothetical protein